MQDTRTALSEVVLRRHIDAGLTEGLLGAVAGLLGGGDDGAVDPLQHQAHMVRVLALLGLARVAVLSQQPLLSQPFTGNLSISDQLKIV